MRVLLTGSAGFIGNALAIRLLEQGIEVVGLDNLNPYYDVRLKEARLERLSGFDNFIEARIDLEDAKAVSALFSEHRPEKVINLAAQAGVRYSLENPQAYVDANITGFLNILEGCKSCDVKHLVYASSSSVYGGNTAMPFSVHHSTGHPVSLYAATKRANELMAHSYSHLYGLPVTGLRFFTVYGPWGRPDMALFKFTEAILEGRPIDVYNQGNMQRDFTYVDDIVDGVLRLLDLIPEASNTWSGDNPDLATSGIAPFRLYNIGNSKPVNLMEYIEVLEKKLGVSAQKNMLPMQPGDVAATWADVEDLVQDTGYKPSTSIEVGVERFVDWYRSFYPKTN
jgi:UDP-glucuronate 4-epimerase